MIRRWWLTLAGLLAIVGTVVAQQGSSTVPLDPYQDKPGRYILPNERPRPIPPQNYREAPKRAPRSGTSWTKSGLFDPNRFHEQFRNRSQRTRAPRWDRDITNAPTDDIHPVYAPGAARMFFASNAEDVIDGKLANPGPRYRIWRGDLDEGSQLYLGNLTNLTPITGDTPDEQFGSQFHPSINQQGNIIAYVNRNALGNTNIVVRNLSTGQRIVLTTDNDGVTQNLRPTLSPGGNLVIFSSNRLLPNESDPADRRFRLYMMRTDGRPFDDGTIIRRMTLPAPGENDIEPAWNPDNEQVAFVRDFGTHSYIFLLNSNTRDIVQWTNFVDSASRRPRDRQPAWSRTGDPQQYILVFASTRKSGTPHQRGELADRVDDSANPVYDIYRYTGILPESTAGQAISVTEDPSGTASPEYPSGPSSIGARYPAGAIIERNRIVYQSNRPNEENNQGPNDLWEVLVFDTTPPVLEILPTVTPKELFPGDEVTVRVRVVDLQSGVDFVRVQFKDPDSAEQDALGEEHKLYWLFTFDIFFPNRILVDQGQAYVPLFVEIGQQAIHPETYQYVEPYSLRALGYDGSLDDTLLLEPELDDNGNPTDWYVATWRTPDVPSDFYLDVIVRDAFGNEFIYDNISGFTTQQFIGANNILLVSDYMGGQIFVQNRVDAIGNSLTRPTWQPVESYWTDNPTGKPPFDVTQPPSGDPLTIIGDGAIPHPNVLGATIRSDTLGRNTTYGNLYDIWRVQCRNPITPAVLSAYLPRIEREPTDLTGGFRDKLHAPRMIMWASPYTGNVWAGPGHVLDPEVQTLLRNFLNQSGRMLMSGQDIAWALSLRGGLANQFLTQTLRAQYESDTAADVVIGPYQGFRRQLVSDGLQAPDEDPNPIPNNPGGIPIWIRIEGGTIQLDPPVELRISHPGEYVITPQGDFIDVIPPVGSTSTTPLYTDAAWNQVWLDSVVVNPDTAAPYRYTPSAGEAGLQLRAGSYYADSATRSKVAFLSFGLEGVNSAYNDTGIQGLLWCRSYRNKVAHNAFAWMTHGVLEGVVRQYDPDTRQFSPLPRALVRITGLAPQSVALQTVGYAITDSTGFYRIVGIEAGTYVVEAERPGFRTQHPEVVTIVANTATVNLIMLATPPGQISGRVVDINGQPVRYAVVQATNTTDPEIVREILSDPDGTFLIPRVPAGTYNVTVVSVADGGYTLPPARPEGGTFTNVQVTAGDTIQLPEDFVLEPLPGTVEGVVRDAETNAPIAGARVTATAGTTVRADVTTDENGAYSFDVPAGQYVITAVAPGYAPNSATVTVPSSETTTVNLFITRLPPGSISGRVVRRFGGAPEPGVLIELLFNDVVVDNTTTDSEGNYSLPEVPPGTYVVRPSKTGFTFIPSERTITVNSSQNTVVPNFQSEPLRTFFRGKYLVSAPYDYTTDIRDLLDVPATANFRFFGWDTEQGRYVFHPNPEVGTFTLGRGYFLETDVDLPLAIEGTPAPNAPFEIPLRKGWNLIGNPFTFDVNWDGVQFIDPDTNTTISLPTAVGKQLVANALWGYSFGSYIATRRMKVWEGYWVYAFRDVTLIIPPTATFTAASRSVPANPMGWRLTIEASVGDSLDRAYVGVSRSATTGYDSEHDLLKPPAIGDNKVRISMPRLSWGEQSGDYGVDIQSVSRSASWEFVVETDEPNREVTLRWTDIQQLPRSANLVLVNLQTGERRFLRTTGSYTFRSSGVSRFRLEMASSGGLLRINNLQVTSGRGSQHTVAFNLTGDANVQVNIIAGGKVVRTLMNQASRSAGLQQVSWDGRDQNGIALPPGSYTVEIRATSEDGQTARAVTTLILTR